MPQTVLRRYTPPTCTLEVMATGSALSRWTDRAVLKNLRFRLHLDDPKLPAENQVTLQGDRNQLEALCEAVDGYVQNWLSRSTADSLPLERRVEAGATALQVLEPTMLQRQPTETNVSESAMVLEPQGLLAHRLHLGTMATEQSSEPVSLSTLQLFDLANALDQYQSDAVTLPSLARPSWMRSPSGWAGIAAAAVLTVGVTGAIAKFVMDVSSPPLQTASTSVQTETNLSQGTPTSPTPLAIPSPPGSPSPSLSLTPLQPPAPPPGAVQTAPPPPSVSIARDPVPVAPAPAPPVVEVPRSTTPPPPERIAIVPPEGTVQQPSITAIPEIESSAARSAEQDIAAANAPEAETGDSAGAAASSTAFDAVPQVSEIRQYFEQNWQPPTELTQTLEYRLVLNADGSLQRIVPLGQAAETFLDRTNMPLMGEPFVSPTDNGGNPQIRLVLRPDGKVQTFLEYAR